MWVKKAVGNTRGMFWYAFCVGGGWEIVHWGR